jgi:hypothetical protein
VILALSQRCSEWSSSSWKAKPCSDAKIWAARFAHAAQVRRAWGGTQAPRGGGSLTARTVRRPNCCRILRIYIYCGLVLWGPDDIAQVAISQPAITPPHDPERCKNGGKRQRYEQVRGDGTHSHVLTSDQRCLCQHDPDCTPETSAGLGEAAIRHWSA